MLAAASVLACGEEVTLPARVAMPEVRGQLLDATTMKPVVGAQVCVWWRLDSTVWRGGFAPVDPQCATTDTGGSFRVPAHAWTVDPPRYRKSSRLVNVPIAASLHRQYGRAWLGPPSLRPDGAWDFSPPIERNEMWLN